jgi:hypothetical protein
MASVWDWLFGSENKLEKKPTGMPEQGQFGQQLIQWLQQMQGQGGGFNAANQYDQNLLQGGQEGFNNFAQPYNQQFEQKILPGIAEKYAGAGALSSSGFGQAIGGAASDFQSQLAQLFSSLQGQAAQRQQGQFANLSQLGLGYSPFAYHEKQGLPGLVPGAVNSFAKGAGNAIGSSLFG